MKKNKYQNIYEDPCWGHNCDKYQEPGILHAKVMEIIENRRNDTVFAYVAFLGELGLLPSTPQHWKECKPLNLKVLEVVKMLCDQSIFNSIKNEPKLIFEYWKLTKDDNKGIDTFKDEDLPQVETFGDSGEFAANGSANNLNKKEKR
jgi:hypothetical protein